MTKQVKHKEDLRTVILEAAKQLFVQEGFEATSIRKIAKVIGFSPTTIYLYYKDKSDIVYALHQVGFGMLRDRLEPLMAVEDPFERLKACGRNYIRLAFEHPEYYQVMFMLKEPITFLQDETAVNKWPEGEQVLAFLKMTIEECQALGYFKGQNPFYTTIQCWATVHGLVALNITDHLSCIQEIFGMQESVEELIYESFKTLITLVSTAK